MRGRLREIQNCRSQDQNAKESEHDDDGQSVVAPERGQFTKLLTIGDQQAAESETGRRTQPAIFCVVKWRGT